MIAIAALIFFCSVALLPARADSVDVYSELTGKTVLISSALPIPGDALISDLPEEKTNALARMEAEFARQGIVAVQDGPHFVILLTEAQRGTLTNLLNLRGAELAAERSQETMPAGMINFLNVEPSRVLPIYSELSQRIILRPFVLLPNPVRLKTTCPLSRKEAVYAMAAVLALNGTAVVEDGDRFAQVVPIVQRDLVRKRAPKREPGARLLEPNTLPSTGEIKPVSGFERDLERCRKALYEFIHYQGAQDRSAQRLLGLYAHLADKTAEQSTQFDGKPIWFHIETPLSKSELMYAIETTFALNWLRIAQVDDQRIRLERFSERGVPMAK